jgi:hypothetical protein
MEYASTVHSNLTVYPTKSSQSASKTTERTWFLPHSGGWEIGVKMEMWRTTRGRHFLRGPSGATGSSTTSIQVSKQSLEPGEKCRLSPFTLDGVRGYENAGNNHAKLTK